VLGIGREANYKERKIRWGNEYRKASKT